MTKKLKAKEEFVIGKHGIGWVNTDFTKFFGDMEFEPTAMPTFRRLEHNMTDAEIMAEYKAGLCTLGDVIRVLDSDEPKYKDGYFSIFYVKGLGGVFAVYVFWGSDRGQWGVGVWRLDDGTWGAGSRVVSPSVATQSLDASTLKPSDIPTLEQRVAELEA